MPALLPLTHATLAKEFEAILKKGELVPTQCKYFKRDLLYFFYGRAAFRALPKKFDSTAHAKPAFYPACIMLDRNHLPDAVGQLPFDSGAFMSNRLNSELPEEDIDIYALHNETLCLPRCVMAFFEDNEAYHSGRPRQRLVDSNTCGEVYNYYDMLKTRDSNSMDDRSKTFEVRFNEKIPLTRDSVLSLVMPKEWMNRSHLWESIEKLDLKDKLSFYEASLSTPAELMAALRQKVAENLVKMDLLPNDQELIGRLFP